MNKHGCTMGIDIGGTKVLLVLYDRKFRVIAESKFKTDVPRGKKAFLVTLDKHIEEVLETARKERLKLACVGIGCAGLIDSASGKVIIARNIPFLSAYPLARNIAKTAGAPVRVVNDVRAGLYGEFRFGVARGAKHAIGVFVGTGIGGAVIIDGHLHEGATGAAGDIGNYLLHVMSPKTAPGERVLDNVASRTAIAADAAKLAASQASPKRIRKNIATDATQVQSVHLAEAVRDGDKTVIELVRDRARIIGAALSNLVDFINPEVIVLGGGLVEALPKIMRQDIRKSLKAHAAPESYRGLKVENAALGDYAVAAGAACLALGRQTSTKRGRAARKK